MTPATLGSSITFLKCDINSRKSSVSVSPLITQILTYAWKLGGSDRSTTPIANELEYQLSR